MAHSLRTKIIAALIGALLFLFLLMAASVNLILDRQFKNYVVERLNQRIQNIVTLLGSRYQDWGDQWNLSGIETVGVDALGQGFIIKVSDVNGTVIWDAREHNGGMCAAILEHMADNMQGHVPDFSGGYVEKAYPMIMDDVTVGSVTVGYYGPYFYNDEDLQFIGTLNRLLLGAALIASCASLLLGIFVARHLSRPINRVIQSAERIARGDYQARIHEPSSTREIMDLTGTINSLAETLGKQEALRKRLTADVAHELRTPLSAIQSHLEAMIDGIWQPDEARLRSCHEETVRLSKLVGDLEKLTRYDADNMTLQTSRIDLEPLIRRIVTQFQGPMNKAGITLAYHPAEAWVEADEDKMSQVFVNLLSNAQAYTPEGGRVDVSVENDGETVRVSVRDTGIGIGQDDLPHIFERFYRADASRSRKTGGSGIGLAIVKSIVEAHHGTLEVESEPERGSTFTMTLNAIH